MEVRRCVIRGRVQGVGFRAFAVRTARELNVRGTVQNRTDGSVEVVLIVDDEATLDAFLARLRGGPTFSRVDAIECHNEILAGPETTRFEVIP